MRRIFSRNGRRSAARSWMSRTNAWSVSSSEQNRRFPSVTTRAPSSWARIVQDDEVDIVPMEQAAEIGYQPQSDFESAPRARILGEIQQYREIHVAFSMVAAAWRCFRIGRRTRRRGAPSRKTRPSVARREPRIRHPSGIAPRALSSRIALRFRFPVGHPQSDPVDPQLHEELEVTEEERRRGQKTIRVLAQIVRPTCGYPQASS